MDNEKVVEITIEPTVFDQFARMMLGAAAGFIAGKLTENAYNKFVIARRIAKTN